MLLGRDEPAADARVRRLARGPLLHELRVSHPSTRRRPSRRSRVRGRFIIRVGLVLVVARSLAPLER